MNPSSSVPARRVILKGLAAGMVFTAWWLMYFLFHKVSPNVYDFKKYAEWMDVTQILSILFVTGILCFKGSKRWGWSLLFSFSFFCILRLSVIPRLPNGRDFLYGGFLFISELPEVRTLGYRRLWTSHWIAAADIVLIRFLLRDRLFDNASRDNRPSSPAEIACKGLCLSIVFFSALFLFRRYLTATLFESMFSSLLLHAAFPLWATILGCAVLCLGSSHCWRKALFVGLLLSALIGVPLAVVPTARNALTDPAIFVPPLFSQILSYMDKLIQYTVFTAAGMIILRLFVYRNAVAEDVFEWWNHI